MSTSSERLLERLEGIWDQHADRVATYVARRVGRDERDDILAETFATAWRRIEDIPVNSELPWLFRTASFIIANHRRARARQQQLELRVSAAVSFDVDQSASHVPLQVAVAGVLARLSEADREVLRLVEWDRLTSEEGAQVCGCSVAAFRVRLHRARRKFEHIWRLYEDEREQDGHALVI